VAAVILCVFAGEMARAGSITVDNRGIQALSAFALDFTSQSLFADPVAGAVTFSGRYQSSGGFPPLNDTVSYLIALGGNPAGSLGSVMLTIKGITDASQDNTQVDMLFNAVISGPIHPDYTVPNPGPVFAAAEFLRQQNAPDVPTDLSVAILSPIPEPSSFALAAIALVVGVSVGLWRRALI
jgi:hypothetical protein